MILLNDMDKLEKITSADYRIINHLLNPFAPHITEELNEELNLGSEFSISEWPTYDETKTIEENLEIGVQVNGKLRGTIHVKKDEDKSIVESIAIEEENVKKHLEGKEIIKTIIVPNRIVNIVVK